MPPRRRSAGPMPRDNAPVAAIPGAPWSREAPAPRPVRPRAALTGTLAGRRESPGAEPAGRIWFLDDSLAGAGAGVAALPFAQSAPLLSSRRGKSRRTRRSREPRGASRPAPSRGGERHLPKAGTLVDANLPTSPRSRPRSPLGRPPSPRRRPRPRARRRPRHRVCARPRRRRSAPRRTARTRPGRAAQPPRSRRPASRGDPALPSRGLSTTRFRKRR